MIDSACWFASRTSLTSRSSWAQLIEKSRRGDVSLAKAPSHRRPVPPNVGRHVETRCIRVGERASRRARLFDTAVKNLVDSRGEGSEANALNRTRALPSSYNSSYKKWILLGSVRRLKSTAKEASEFETKEKFRKFPRMATPTTLQLLPKNTARQAEIANIFSLFLFLYFSFSFDRFAR